MAVVSIVRVHHENVEDAVRKAVSLTDGFETVAWEGAKVLVKPNVALPAKTGTGIVTDARIVEAVTKLVVERNPKRVVIGEGSSVGYDLPIRLDSIHCMEAAGVGEVARKLGVELVDLNRDERVNVRTPDAFVMERFAIARTALEADVIISLPVIKTHIRTGITCGLKNMKGIIAGGDVVAVDAVCATIAGFDVGGILHIQGAAEAHLGVCDVGLIEVRGEGIDSVKRPFIPFLEGARHLYGGANIIEKDTCTGCVGESVSTFIYLNKAGFHDKLKDLTIIMGTPGEIPPLQGKPEPVVIGRCAKEHRHLGVFVPGCPPHGMKINDVVCQALEVDKKTVQRAILELHNSSA